MEEEKEEKKEVIKFEKTKPQSFKVIKAFTADKHYSKNSVFVSSDKKLIEKLLNEKYIK